MGKRLVNGAASLKIEDGIPLPTPRGAGNYGEITDTLGKLKVSQSVLISQFTKTEQLGSIRQITQAKLNIKLATRVVKGGVRVWRVS